MVIQLGIGAMLRPVVLMPAHMLIWDQYANQRNLSRPKAIAALLKQIHRPEEPARQKTQHKVVLQELKSLREKLKKSSD